ncbi:hypothetical protein WICPIJ_008521 [Wickerhamomyces pijperi]|uniref:Uncharacterized protein n=1 Tax=Wickerhamomyces pijperi TaxID=599730 RepID=A0A9P8PWJ1_WICPI|nr:hypothetical protein WICPIJ_008521 [Wickerhamomyces pijperi]
MSFKMLSLTSWSSMNSQILIFWPSMICLTKTLTSFNSLAVNVSDLAMTGIRLTLFEMFFKASTSTGLKPLDVGLMK